MSIENFGILHGLNNTKIPEEDIVKAYESANEGNLISHLPSLPMIGLKQR